MPQATDEQRAAWGGEMGVGEDKAHAFLMAHGWREVGNGIMRPPRGRSLTQDERDAMDFLIDEWDFMVEQRSPMERMLKHFRFRHLPEFLQVASRPFAVLALQIVDMVPASAERTVALRQLLQAKDCTVRALLELREGDLGIPDDVLRDQLVAPTEEPAKERL